MSSTNETENDPKRPLDFQAMGQAVRDAGRQTQEAGAQAVSDAKEVASEARERAQSISETAVHGVSTTLESQKEGLAGRLDEFADVVHRSGTQFEGHQDQIAHLVERGAAEMHAFANTLRTNDTKALMTELGGFARRQPALFVGATIAAGFALSRVGRVAVAESSSDDLPKLPDLSSASGT